MSLIVGVVIPDHHRAVWKIPEFFSTLNETCCIVYSPTFSIGKRSWCLFVRLGNLLDIGVYQKTNKVSDFKVRLGITSKSVELSSSGILTCGGRGNFDHNKLSLLKADKSFWLPDGNLNLFFTVEDLDKVEKISQQTDNDITKLQNDLEFLLNGHVSDVVVKVDDEEFKCHRCILAARSPVFFAMMTHDTEESASGVINIADADPKTVSCFLQYLYIGNVKNVSSENVFELYVISDKYQIDELKKKCMECIKKNISMENFFDVITLSLRYTEKDLTDACIQFFKGSWNSLEIIKTSKWQKLMSENPVACNELFIKLLEWKKSP